MKVERYSFITANTIYKKSNFAFKHSFCEQSLKNVNIGMASDGFIGKIRVRNSKNAECLLNIIKKSLGDGYENYSVKNDGDIVVGEMNLRVKKYTNYDRLQYQSDPSHVFIDELFNYSNPTTPYYKNMEQYKDIGIRLMQVALKRSYEAMCNGELKLISKNESKKWYKGIIGMVEEFPETLNSNYGFSIHNPNSMILPLEARERLSILNGGL
jgi:hypothetical protein